MPCKVVGEARTKETVAEDMLLIFCDGKDSPHGTCM